MVTPPQIGDEYYIPDVEIQGDDLPQCNGGGVIDNIESHELCRNECDARKGICGSWTYYPDKRCVLKTTYSCCGQKDKQIKREGVISGNLVDREYLEACINHNCFKGYYLYWVHIKTRLNFFLNYYNKTHFRLHMQKKLKLLVYAWSMPYRRLW